MRLRNEHDIALMIVSHDYDLHGDLIERVVELEDGRIVRDEGAVEWTDRTEAGTRERRDDDQAARCGGPWSSRSCASCRATRSCTTCGRGRSCSSPPRCGRRVDLAHVGDDRRRGGHRRARLAVRTSRSALLACRTGSTSRSSSAALNLLSGVEPTFDVGGISLSLGGVEQWARFTALAVVLVTSSALVGWTTPLGDVALLRTLFRPLRWLRLPVDEWVMAIALAIRCLPMLIDEIRLLGAARRLRVHGANGLRDQDNLTIRQLLVEVHDLLATASSHRSGAPATSPRR